jgi:hypothetical protein
VSSLTLFENEIPVLDDDNDSNSVFFLLHDINSATDRMQKIKKQLLIIFLIKS